MRLINLEELAFFGPGSESFWTMLRCVALTVTFLLIYRQLRVQGHANVINEYHAMHRRWNSALILRATNFCPARARTRPSVRFFVADSFRTKFFGRTLAGRSSSSGELWKRIPSESVSRGAILTWGPRVNTWLERCSPAAHERVPRSPALMRQCSGGKSCAIATGCSTV